jgi:hypothetical protein
MRKKRIGSSLDSMLEDLGELAAVRILTQKKILVRQLDQVRRAGNVSISEMARRMGTSRMAVHSLLDPTKPTMTIDSASRAAAALDADLEVNIVPHRMPFRPPAKTKRRADRRRTLKIKPVVVDGKGLSDEFRQAPWHRVRAVICAGRGE